MQASRLGFKPGSEKPTQILRIRIIINVEKHSCKGSKILWKSKNIVNYSHNYKQYNYRNISHKFPIGYVIAFIQNMKVGFSWALESIYIKIDDGEWLWELMNIIVKNHEILKITKIYKVKEVTISKQIDVGHRMTA